jgi:hypothetical protein
MQRNSQVVVNKVNVVVVSIVVVVVLVLTIVSIVRVIGGIDNVVPGIATEKAEIIKAVPEDNGMTDIAGVVVVNPVVIDLGHVDAGVTPVVKTPIALGYIDASLDLGDVHIGDGISRLAENSDIITVASADESEISEIHASIYDIDSVDAGTVSGISTAPISSDCIDELKAESIARIQIQAAEGIDNDGITNITAASINGRSDAIGLIS